VLDLIAKLVSIPSFTGNFEAMDACFSLCRDFLGGSAGIYEEEIVHRGYKSVIFSNSNSPSLKFDVISPCHMDVVPIDNYKLAVSGDGGKIFGRGVFDMKSFIVSSLVNLRDMGNKNLGISYGVVITSDEETGGENGIGYLVNTLALETSLVLDCDSGGCLENIARENLGATTIKLYGNKNDMAETIMRLRIKFSGYHCENYGDEVDINFGRGDICQNLKECMIGDTEFKILMLNDYIAYDIDNKFHRLYKKIMEDSAVKANYVTTRGTSDSRYFSAKKITVISHQASGGGSHGESEWLDLDSLFIFNGVQKKFLSLAAELVNS
jgi:acetylornithine deacetylase/succinyl-diaminopimelate desuccinylase-like protein